MFRKPKRRSALGHCLLVSLVLALLAPLLNVLLGIGELGASPFLSVPGPEGGQITLEIGGGGPWWERLLDRLRQPAFWDAWLRAAAAYFVVALVASLSTVLLRGDGR